MSELVDHVVAAIGAASQANAQAVRARIAPVGTPVLERLGTALAGAQHTPHPRAARCLIVVAAGDHGCGDPGIAMGADHPTVVAARAIADGSAALCQLARTASAPIVLVDAGVREADELPDIAIKLGRGPSRDLLRGPAMSVADAMAGVEAGIALSITLSEHPLDVLALGALGVGADVASAALLGALTGRAPTGLGDAGAETAGKRGAASHRKRAEAPKRLGREDQLAPLAAFGGPDTALLAGLILGAASLNVPVILDSYATGAAALVAAALAPQVTGYLIAAHRGGFTHPAIVEQLGLVPAFEIGLGHGEGTGAAIVLPLLVQVAALAAER